MFAQSSVKQHYFLEKIEFEELYDEQLIYKRTPMDFIDHLWELLSRNIQKAFMPLSVTLLFNY